MEFFKILWNNLVKGPVTEPFAHAEAHTPARFRGRVVVDPALCVGCGICRHVCTAGAINITARPDNSGYDIVVWHNSCCLCGQCRHYCPTGAAVLSTDWHTAHRADQTYTAVEHQFVAYDTCEQCGALQRFLPPGLTQTLYAGMPELEGLPDFERLCVTCRMVGTAVAEERACRLAPPPDQAEKADQLERPEAPEQSVNKARDVSQAAPANPVAEPLAQPLAGKGAPGDSSPKHTPDPLGAAAGTAATNTAPAGPESTANPSFEEPPHA